MQLLAGVMQDLAFPGLTCINLFSILPFPLSLLSPAPLLPWGDGEAIQ